MSACRFRFRLKYYLRYVKEYLRSFPPRLHMLSPCHFVRRLYHRTIQYTVYLKCPTQSSLGGTIDSCGPSSRQGIRLVQHGALSQQPPILQCATRSPGRCQTKISPCISSVMVIRMKSLRSRVVESNGPEVLRESFQDGTVDSVLSFERIRKKEMPRRPRLRDEPLSRLRGLSKQGYT